MPNRTSKTDRGWWRNFALLRNLAMLFTLLWQVNPWLFVGTIVVRIGRAVVPIGLLWIPKQILDGVVALTHGHGDVKRIWWLLVAEFILASAADGLAQLNSVLDGMLGEKFTTHIAVKLIDHVSALDLSTFENPIFYDKLERVRGQATGRMLLLTSIMNAVQEVITLVVLSTGLTVFSPWLALLLVVATVPTFVGEERFSKLSYSAFFRRTPQRRYLEYLRLLGSWSDSAKEVRIFGLGPYLTMRYRQTAAEIYRENAVLALERAAGGWLLGLLALLGYYCGYVVVVRAVLGSVISLGMFTFLAGSLMRARMSTERAFSYLNGVADQALLLTDLFDIFTLKPTIASIRKSLTVPPLIRRGFEFRNVSFAYPGSETAVVHDLSFTIRPKERVAIVGGNGAGKSTVVKLLARLYEPTLGQILLDGRDLRDYHLPSLRECVKVVFQDYMRYDFTLRENVHMGAVESSPHSSKFEAAVDRAELKSIAEKLANGYDQMLGRRFEGGVDLSGGEWQKVALARAFASDARLLIFDEPTSHLDTHTEAEFYRCIRENQSGAMVVLISHRLSCVRWVDKVVVLDNGEICEIGTHDELLERGGRYATLFRIQSDAFLAPDEKDPVAEW